MRYFKLLHGFLYRLLLSAIVKPPEVSYDGRNVTIVRKAIYELLKSWQDRIQGDVLDVGVGTWTYSRELLEDRCNYLTADCFNHENIDVVCDIQELGKAFEHDSFDYVICTEVLEHVQYPWLAVEEIAKVLRPEGVLLLTTPFNFHLHRGDNFGDYWRISADGLRVIIEDVAKLKIDELTPVGHPEFPFSHVVVAHKP